MRLQIPFLLLILALAGSGIAAQEAPQVSDARLETASAASGLEAAIRQASRSREPLWVAWSVPMIGGQRTLCCFSTDKNYKKWERTTCRLEGKNQSWGSFFDGKPVADQTLLVLLRVEAGKPDQIRSFSTTCPLDAGGRRFVWLTGAQPEASVAYLAGLARPKPEAKGKEEDELAEQALSTLAYHRNARADDVLEELASAPFSVNRREKALFWIGQTRGKRGARFLTRVVTSDPSEDIREKAIFSLSQSEAPGAVAAIIRASREDKSPKVRGEALFWLAQTGDTQAPERILQAIDNDPDREVKKKGVFALSQLPEGQGVTLLARVGRESRDREIRKEAFFWLAQSDDPAALKYLDKVLND